VTEAHHPSDAARVILVGLDRTRGQKALRLSRLDADDRYARFKKRPMEPLGQRARLDPGELHVPKPLRQPLDERAGPTWNLPLPLYSAVAVDNADRRFHE
jgi:hypothetical protein